MTLKYIWSSFQPRLSFPRPFQQSLACFRVARSPSNSWASCLFWYNKTMWWTDGQTDRWTDRHLDRSSTSSCIACYSTALVKNECGRPTGAFFSDHKVRIKTRDDFETREMECFHCIGIHRVPKQRARGILGITSEQILAGFGNSMKLATQHSLNNYVI